MNHQPTTLNRTKVTTIPFSWDSAGYAEELITMDIPIDYNESPITQLRLAILAINYQKELLGHSQNINSQYDCTALPFGSKFTRLYWAIGEDTISVLYLHSYSLDI